MNIHMAKKWSEKVVQRSFTKEHSFGNSILEETPKVNRKMKIRQAFPNPIIVDASQETPRLYRKMKP